MPDISGPFDEYWEEQRDELMKRQGGKCGGCQIPLSSIGSGEGDEPEKLRAEREAVKLDPNVARMGWINLRTPRRLRGKDEPSNRWLLCTDCMGSTTVNSQMPTWLFNKATAYRDENLEDFRSMTHLMRTALEHYISTDDEKRQRERMYEHLKVKHNAMVSNIESLSRSLDSLSDDLIILYD